MRRKSSKGKCGYCSNVYSGRGMTRHLRACKARKSSIEEELSSYQGRTSPIFLLKVSSGPLYWLFIEVDGSAKLKALDSFLRDIWVECCGHLSRFKINEVRYDSHLFNEPTFSLFSISKPKSMEVELSKVLIPGLKFGYEYDFGSTTYLDLKVISVRGGRPNKSIRLISKNNPLSFKCVSCGKEAAAICTQCMWKFGCEGSVFCDDCITKHKCGEEMALPIVNSPRMGVCGYTGPDKEFPLMDYISY